MLRYDRTDKHKKSKSTFLKYIKITGLPSAVPTSYSKQRYYRADKEHQYRAEKAARMIKTVLAFSFKIYLFDP